MPSGRTMLPGTNRKTEPVRVSAAPLVPEFKKAGMIAAIAELLQIRWSLMMLGVSMFTFSIVTYWLPLGEVGIIIALLGLILQRDDFRAPAFVWLFAAFILWAFLSTFFSQYPEIARDQVLERLKLVLVMLVLVNALRTAGQIRFLKWFFLGCFMLFPVRGALVNYFVFGETIYGRILWNYVYQNPNDLAVLSLLALGVALSLALSQAEQRFMRVIAGISSAALLVVILLTQSRGVFLGTAISMGPTAAMLTLKRPARVFYAAIAITILALSIPDTVWQRFSGISKLTNVETIAEADTEGSAGERWEIQKVAWKIATDHPLFGVGLGTYSYVNAEYAPQLGRKDTHNTYLNIASEVGMPGLLLWGTLVISVLRYALHCRKNAGTMGQASQQVWMERATVGFFVAGAVGSYSALTFPYLMLSLLWCSSTLLKQAAAPMAINTRLRIK